MREIRIHGRGGQGSVTAAELLAVAAFEDGRYSQAFPFFGVERRGAPVTAFARVSDRPIRLRSQIYEPDYVILQDSTLIGVVDIASSIKPDGVVIVNTKKDVKTLGLNTKAGLKTVDATKIAMKVLGRPIVNTVLLGAFSAVTGLVSVNSLKKSVKERFPGEVGEKNAKAIQKVFDMVRMGNED
jgi:pyruvate ferredoxin oxidoreductase gamma subunit